MLFRRRALFLAGIFAAVSCSDARNPAGPETRPRPVPEPEDVVQALSCTVNVAAQQLACAPPTPGTGAAHGLVLGGPNGSNVLLTSSNFARVDDTLSFDVTVQNLIGQALGTTDGSTADPDGIRIFFYPEPSFTRGPGPVTDFQILSDGTAIFLGGMSDYFQYDPQVLPTNATSPSERWRFRTLNVQSFSFEVYVSAKVQFPKGWVDIDPDAPLIEVGGVDTLTARVRSAHGRSWFSGANWTSSNAAVVTLAELMPGDTMVEITGVSEGTAWVRAVSAVDSLRRDSVLVTVNNAPVVTTDSIDALTNVTDSIPAPRLLGNLDPGAAIIPGTYPTWAGGTATVYADGGFTYLSPPEFVGTDTINYPVTDGAWTVDGKVIVNVLPGNDPHVRLGARGDGRDRSPVGSLAAAVAMAGRQRPRLHAARSA